jgi:lipoprotein-anchoring transpeptidase ErfK/SrfK
MTASLPPEDQPEVGEPKELPANLQRQLVDFKTKEPAGTIIIDTGNTYLYLVLGSGKAIRYGIGVGRDGFTWSGTERISRMKEWPDWFPPSEMIERQPYLPRMMAGGPGNPLGARALYLGHTLYRIHGTNQPSTIGQNVSSGCIRLLNKDIEDLYSRVQVGTRVVVLPAAKPAPAVASAHPAVANPQQSAQVGAAPVAAPQQTGAISSAPLPTTR